MKLKEALVRPFSYFKDFIPFVIIFMILGAISSWVFLTTYLEGFVFNLGNTIAFVFGIIIMLLFQFFFQGYLFESARLTLKKKKPLPKISSWKNFFSTGFMTFIISLLYCIPLGILGGLMALAMHFEIMALAVLIGVLLFFAAVLFFYILPSALLSYVAQYNFNDAFSKSVWKKAFTGDYLSVLLVAALIAMGISLVAGLLMVPFVLMSEIGVIVNLLIRSLIGIYLGVFMYTLLAETYANIKIKKR